MDLVRLFRLCNVYMTESIANLDNMKLKDAQQLKKNVEVFSKFSEDTQMQVAALITQMKEQFSAPISFFKVFY